MRLIRFSANLQSEARGLAAHRCESLVFLDGSRIDFVTEGLKQMFKFDNPNVDSECDCGESFNVKKQTLDEINTEVTA